MPKRKPAKASSASTPPSTLAEVERQLDRIRARLALDDAAPQLEKMSPNIYTKLSIELRGWTKLKNEIESKAAISEDRIALHPKFIELRDSIITALAQYPDAAQAVVEALGGKP